ncbi:MAG TPA: amino acid adenylation domain-containing protein, partial [Kofleriaceae bacterium]|nr:amino acid adenylation domain-containing protein [Kofleriaceae bacterium]
MFSHERMRALARHYHQLLRAIAEDPDRPVLEHPLMAEAERQEILSWNPPQRPVPRETLSRAIAAQAQRSPHAIAVEHGDARWTYRQLDDAANRLARRLLDAGVDAEARVAVCLPRSPWLVVAVLGVQKAGVAYVPIDPHYPLARRRFMLEDARAALLIAAPGGDLDHPHTLSLDDGLLDGPGPEPGPESDPEPDRQIDRSEPEHAAYVLYTSGSTGVPKGIVVEHRAACNHMRWMLRTWPIAPTDVILQRTPISFDASVWELFVPLMAGARLHLVTDDDARDPRALIRLIARAGVTIMQCVPSLLGALVAEPELAGCRTLARIFCGGEPLTAELIAQVGSRLDVEIHNLYGPAEATIDATWWPCGELPPGAPVPIGRPIDNVKTYVVDRRGGLAPVGVPGELYIGGAGLARGYLGRPDWTAERFVPDPFSGRPGARLYRTGDLARWRADGVLEFLGRIDHQVKLRGFRIELGEIDAALRAHPAIRDAAAAVSEVTGDKQLVAYVVLHDAADRPAPTAAELRRELAARLPEHMVPNAFVVLDSLPRNPSGKLDRAALPAPPRARRAPTAGADLPGSELEQRIAAIWRDVLGVDDIGVHDDFFELGGHSLIATRVISRIHAELHVELSLRELFAAPTVAGLAALARSAPGEATAPSAIPRVPRGGPLAASFGQSRMWFLDQLAPHTPLYNLPRAIRLPRAVDPEILDRVVAALIGRHESLRYNFIASDGQPAITIAPRRTIDIPVVDLRSRSSAQRDAEAQQLFLREALTPFDLASDSLVRFGLIRIGPEDHIVLVTMHHIISDGWSMGVLEQELLALYDAFAAGRPSPLPALPIQYADFAAWQRRELEGPRLAELVGYWTAQLADAPPVIDLPHARPRPRFQSFRGAVLPFAISPDLTRSLRALARAEDATLFMVLLAGFQAVLHRYSGQRTIVIGSPIAGRTRPEL